MNRIFLVLFLLAIATPLTARAQSSATHAGAEAPPAAAPQAAVSQSQAQRTLDVLRDEKKRAALITTLETIAKTAPDAPAPVAAQAAAPAAKPELPLPLKPGSVGAEVLFGVSGFLDHLSEQTRETIVEFEGSPALVRGFRRIANDPVQRLQLLDALWRLAATMGCGLAAEWLALRAVRRPQRRLIGVAANAYGHPAAPRDDPAEEDDPGHPREGGAAPAHRRRASALTFLRRLPLAFGRLALDLLPVLAFAVVAHLLLGSPLAGSYFVRLIVLALVDAYAITRAMLCVARMMLSPDNARLRLLRLSDASATYLMRWTRALVAVATFGFALSGALLLLGGSQSAHDAALKLVSLVVHVMLIVMVVQKRAAVARRLRAPKAATGLVAALWNRFAAIWHIVAIFLLVATWVVWAVELPNGFSRLLHFIAVTGGILIVSRIAIIIALGTLDRADRAAAASGRPLSAFEARMHFYRPIGRTGVTALIYIATVLALFQVWGFGSLAWLSTSAGQRVLASLASIAVTMTIGLLLWEAANGAVQKQLDRLAADQHLARAARLRTLLPLLRTTLLTALLVVVGLMVLSDIGVNIAPLLAGAGVLGIAIGFGSQKLVQDVITGLFLLLENSMQVGDVVTAGGLSGVVEYLSIRSIRLRAEDGSVHLIPFSAVTTVTNMTRDFGFAVIEAQVSYADDYGDVVAILQGIAAEMRRDPTWASEIRDDLELMGLDRFAGSAVVIKGRIRVGPFGRWSVLREFNRRMKQRFDENGIEIPSPQQQLVVTQPAAAQLAAASGSPAGSAEVAPEKADSQEAIRREKADR